MKKSKIFMVSMALCAFFTVSPSFAMEGGEPQESNLTAVKKKSHLKVLKLHSFKDLKIEDGGVLILDIDSTLLHRSSKPSGKTTSLELLGKHEAFCEAVKQIDLASYEKLKKAGRGMIEKTEDYNPEILQNLSRQNVILIPYTSRGASEENIKKTTEQLRALGYTFSEWNEGKLKLLGTEYGDASLKDGILYGSLRIVHPDKGSGVKAVTEELGLDYAFVDDKKKNTKAVKIAMASSSREGKIYRYIAPARQFNAEKIEMIYRHTLKEKFEEHEELFKKHFY
ncbi:MAG: hypothetical protein BGO67_00945 [Alphaproteobacteria bacterium 41-28]|nr:MAG: hypothetical protein BGO67_00945 [Alphaproteobacteria bacterium 41-28]